MLSYGAFLLEIKFEINVLVCLVSFFLKHYLLS